jgi:predicted RNA binding protein YcfA (HicA-like mRNA interferase family)
VEKIPSLSYAMIAKVLEKEEWIIVQQSNGHVRLQKHLPDGVLKITLPAHRPVKRSTLSHILKQARIDLERFLKLL